MEAPFLQGYRFEISNWYVQLVAEVGWIEVCEFVLGSNQAHRPHTAMKLHFHLRYLGGRIDQKHLGATFNADASPKDIEHVRLGQLTVQKVVSVCRTE